MCSFLLVRSIASFAFWPMTVMSLVTTLPSSRHCSRASSVPFCVVTRIPDRTSANMCGDHITWPRDVGRGSGFGRYAAHAAVPPDQGGTSGLHRLLPPRRLLRDVLR